MPDPTADQLREYARRDWDFQARIKAAGVGAGTPDEALALSQMLWDHMQSVDPRWPDTAQRRADLEHHQRLERRKQRISDVFFSR